MLELISRTLGKEQGWLTRGEDGKLVSTELYLVSHVEWDTEDMRGLQKRVSSWAIFPRRNDLISNVGIRIPCQKF